MSPGQHRVSHVHSLTDLVSKLPKPQTNCCAVRPPLIHDDVSRPAAMTTKEFAFAQGLTKKPVKGMLTGEGA